jgi:hypothetical protein
LQVWICPWHGDGGVGYDQVGLGEVHLTVLAKAKIELSLMLVLSQRSHRACECILRRLIRHEHVSSAVQPPAGDAKAAAEAAESHHRDSANGFIDG